MCIRDRGNFTTSTHIQLSGPFQEESVVTAVGTPSAGVQSVTFTSRYAWDNANGNSNAALVMQGGPGGQAFIQAGYLGLWPIAYQVVGATSTTKVYFSNCLGGQCNGTSSSNIIPPGLLNQFVSGTLTRASNVVTLTGVNSPYRVYPVSYTHLDVYKRQSLDRSAGRSTGPEG